MKQEKKNNPTLALQLKHSLWWGLLLGSAVGASLAFYRTWVADQFIKKGLTIISLEIFFENITLATLAALAAFLLLGPGLAVLSRLFGEIRHMRIARLAVVVLGLVLIVGGYYLNKSEWFPPILSLLGIVGNGFFSLACLAMSVGLYKVLLKTKIRMPGLGHGFLRKTYSKGALVSFLLIWGAFNGYALWKISSLKPEGPNLLFITIDTLRADRLGCYGYERDTSPAVDALAKDGVLFSQAFAQRGLTWPSLTSIMTSLYPKTHGVLSNQIPLDGHYVTLAEMLKNVGYKTGAFLANFYYAPNRGFDVKEGGEIGNLDKSITREALDWLDQVDQGDDRFFMWVHYKNPHDPYTPPGQFATFFDSTYTGPFDGSRPVLDSIYVNKVDLKERDLAHLNALYDAEIRSSDSYIEQLLDRLEEKGLTDNTLIVFSSDHGEEMYEHNHYFFHSCSMYDGVLRIPLIMKFPEVVPEGHLVENQVESIDIVPTILEFLKLPLLDEFEGRSLLPIIYGQVNGAWRPAFAERASSMFSIRTPEWKYIYNPDNYHTYCSRSDEDQGDGYIIGAEELYHMPSDPKERNNVASKHPELTLDLRSQIIEWVNTNKREHKEYKLTEEAEKRLKALGYMK